MKRMSAKLIGRNAGPGDSLLAGRSVKLRVAGESAVAPKEKRSAENTEIAPLFADAKPGNKNQGSLYRNFFFNRL